MAAATDAALVLWAQSSWTFLPAHDAEQPVWGTLLGGTQGAVGSCLAQPQLTSGGVCADVAAATVGAALSPGAL